MKKVSIKILNFLLFISIITIVVKSSTFFPIKPLGFDPGEHYIFFG